MKSKLQKSEGYLLYFKNTAGKHHPPLSMNNLKDVLEIATIYRAQAPEIIITDNLDRSILHTKNGEFLFPKFKKGEIQALDYQFGSEELPSKKSDLEQSLKGYQSELQHYNELMAAVKKVAPKGNEIDLQEQAHDVKAAEIATLAMASKFKSVNLYERGYEPSNISYPEQTLEQERGLEPGLEI